MKTIIRANLVIFAVFVALAAYVYAGDKQTSNGFFPRSAVQQWHGERFTLQRLDFLRKRDIFRNLVINWASSHPRDVHQLQAAIRANPSLLSTLKSKNVEINNVVGMQSAGNGGLVIYLR